MQEHHEIFISTTSGDLGSVRRAISDELLKLDYYPVTMDTFGTTYGRLVELLEAKVRRCDAVVHIVGLRYGAEPGDVPPNQTRRSYTQIEYDTARRLKKPLIVYVCGDGFPYDQSSPESPELQALQERHRAQVIRDRGQIRHLVNDRARLLEGIMRLRISNEIQLARTESARSYRAVAILLIAIAVGLLAFAWTLLGGDQGANPLVP